MDSACCRPVVVECNLWASCGEPPPLFVVERCSLALCFPLFLLSFFFEQMDRFVLWAWRVASSFFFFCLGLGLCLLLQSSFQLLFMVLVAWQPFVPRLFDTVSNTSASPFNNQPIEVELTSFLVTGSLFWCGWLVNKRIGIHSVCSLFSFWLLLCSREAFLFVLL